MSEHGKNEHEDISTNLYHTGGGCWIYSVEFPADFCEDLAEKALIISDEGCSIWPTHTAFWKSGEEGELSELEYVSCNGSVMRNDSLVSVPCYISSFSRTPERSDEFILFEEILFEVEMTNGLGLSVKNNNSTITSHPAKSTLLEP